MDDLTEVLQLEPFFPNNFYPDLPALGPSRLELEGRLTLYDCLGIEFPEDADPELNLLDKAPLQVVVKWLEIEEDGFVGQRFETDFKGTRVREFLKRSNSFLQVLSVVCREDICAKVGGGGRCTQSKKCVCTP